MKQAVPAETPYLSRISRQLYLRPAMAPAGCPLGAGAGAAGGLVPVRGGRAATRAPATSADLLRFIDEIDRLLRREHDEDYCGIVYADDPVAPTMVKIYDPNNLGVSCGYSDNPPLPGWVLSRLAPVDLAAARQPAGRRRWWQRLFSG